MLIYFVFTAQANEAVVQVLERHLITDPVKLSYTQTRFIQLLDKPVVSTGVLYSTAKYFVLHQAQPEQLVIASNHKRLWFYDATKAKKYTYRMSSLKQKDPALAVLISAFRVGDMQALEKQFMIKTTETVKGWVVDMLPTQQRSKRLYKSITLQGKSNQMADRFSITYANGNQTVWKFKQQPFLAETTKQVKVLVLKAGGL